MMASQAAVCPCAPDTGAPQFTAAYSSSLILMASPSRSLSRLASLALTDLNSASPGAFDSTAAVEAVSV